MLRRTHGQGGQKNKQLASLDERVVWEVLSARRHL